MESILFILGLGSILFAISIDKLEFNTSIAPRPMLLGYQEEPVIPVPIPGKILNKSKLVVLVSTVHRRVSDNKDKKDRSRRKVARQLISFDDDDSMLSTSVPSISSSSTCSDSSSIGHQNKGNQFF